MKKLLLLSLLASIFTMVGFKERSKSHPQWYVTASYRDQKLSKNESAFTFRFTTDSNNEVSGDVIFSCNGKTDTLKSNLDGSHEIFVKPGKYIFQFFYTKNHLEVKTDSITIQGGYHMQINVSFIPSDMEIICDKPVIYVYPKDTTQVSIRLDLKGEIGFTYPYYDIGWNFIADPDGTIHMNDKKYHYLFWDGRTMIDNNSIDWNEGFIVERDSLVPFFEEKLKLMGLNSKEAEDYITYWCPRMVVNDKNYIHFMFNEEYNEYAGLEINPAPDKMFRVFMLWTKSEENKNTQVIPQSIESFERGGFTIVEWGGAEMPRVPVIFDAQASN